jgi:hypothetical protein
MNILTILSVFKKISMKDGNEMRPMKTLPFLCICFKIRIYGTKRYSGYGQ